MKKENIQIKSNCDGLMIDVEIFIPDGNIKGIVQLSHGMVEHKVYYYDFMEYLTEIGYVTIINDHRGHGRSIKDKADLGYFYEESSDFIVEDLHQVTEYIKGRFPEKDVILIGHSMGSLIVRKYIKKYDDEINKLIVCGSPSINKASKAGWYLCKIFKFFKGDRYRSALLNTLALSSDKTNQWISNDIEYLKKCGDDELCGYIFTTNGFINLTKLMIDVYSKKGWELNNKGLEILFIAGKDDMVIKSEKKWNESIEFLKKIGYKNIDKILYPNMKHAILKEIGKEKVYDDVIKFIEKN